MDIIYICIYTQYILYNTTHSFMKFEYAFFPCSFRLAQNVGDEPEPRCHENTRRKYNLSAIYILNRFLYLRGIVYFNHTMSPKSTNLNSKYKPLVKEECKECEPT